MKILIYTLFPLLMFVGCDEPEEKENEKATQTQGLVQIGAKK